MVAEVALQGRAGGRKAGAALSLGAESAGREAGYLGSALREGWPRGHSEGGDFGFWRGREQGCLEKEVT